MSLINKMLRDLDQRQELGVEPALEGAKPEPVKSANRAASLWPMIAVLVILALAAVGWFIWKGRPTKIISDLAFQSSEATKKSVPPPVIAPAPPPTAQVTPPQPPPIATPAPPEPSAPDPVVVESKKQAAANQAVQARRKSPAAASKPQPDPARIAAEAAEARYRKAVELLNGGRVSEAEDALAAALQADSGHSAARQAYAALLVEQRRLPAAQKVIAEGLAKDPTQSQLALALARIYADQRDYPAALEVLDRAGSAARGSDFLSLRGAILQRMGRHADAVEAFQQAASTAVQEGRTWMGLAVSLDALGRRPEAADAYRRALAVGPLEQGLRDYAEKRTRALK